MTPQENISVKDLQHKCVIYRIVHEEENIRDILMDFFCDANESDTEWRVELLPIYKSRHPLTLAFYKTK